MIPAQIKQAEEFKKVQSRLHEDWLKHPVTQDFIKIMNARVVRQTKELQEGILVASDKDKESNYRSSIIAHKATIIILQDTNFFVTELNKLTPNT